MTVVEQLGRQTESNILQWILSHLVTGAFVCFLCSIVIVIKLCLRKRRKDIFCSGQIRNRSEGGAPGCVCSIILSFAFSAKLAPTDPSTYNKHSKKYGYIRCQRPILGHHDALEWRIESFYNIWPSLGLFSIAKHHPNKTIWSFFLQKSIKTDVGDDNKW